jgi:hypothetical protein
VALSTIELDPKKALKGLPVPLNYAGNDNQKLGSSMINSIKKLLDLTNKK